VLLCCLGTVALAAEPAQGRADKPSTHWLRQLQSADAKEREDAVRELGSRLASIQLPEKQSVVSGLRHAMEDPIPLVRREAARSLSGLDTVDKELLAALRKAAKDPDARVCVAAQGALWKYTKEEASLVAIMGALKDQSPAVRGDVVFALETFAPSRKTVTVLITIISKDPNRDVRRSAGVALNRLCAQLHGAAREAVPALVELLDNDDEYLRGCELGALGRIDREAKAALPAVIRALKARQRFAAWALGRIGSDGKTVVPALVEALSDKDHPSRVDAAYALGTLGGDAKPAVPALRKATEDKSVHVRVAARLALWRATGDEKQVALAFTDAAEKKSSAEIDGVVWLGGLDPPAVSVLVDLLKHPTAKSRTAAALAMGTLDEPASKRFQR
jgi:HEAT repeat protein